jgi:hypothetical protein
LGDDDLNKEKCIKSSHGHGGGGNCPPGLVLAGSVGFSLLLLLLLLVLEDEAARNRQDARNRVARRDSERFSNPVFDPRRSRRQPSFTSSCNCILQRGSRRTRLSNKSSASSRARTELSSHPVEINGGCTLKGPGWTPRTCPQGIWYVVDPAIIPRLRYRHGFFLCENCCEGAFPLPPPHLCLPLTPPLPLQVRGQ